MLDVIGQGFKQAKQVFAGQATLNETNVQKAVDLIRSSLLDGDVEYTVAKNFLAKVKEKSLGQTVDLKAGSGSQRLKVTPQDHFVNICRQELEALMGPVDTSIHFAPNRPTVIMMVGLQGSGKTTSTGKLTRYLIETKHRKPLLAAADVYRPAAIEQLKVLGQRLSTPVFALGTNANPVDIATQAVAQAFKDGRDTVLIDTAGRLAIDEALMTELVKIKAAVKPDHIFFVCDAMMGQDAVATAKTFHDRLNISGIIMTKLDGDARGGAALSIKEVTGAPIKFLGMGESLEKLEEFRPEGMASRILGLGDIVGLMQDFEKVAHEDQEKDAMRMLQGKFSFKDFYQQISMIQQMGSLKDIVAKLPMQDFIPKGANIDDGELLKIRSMIDSMTEKERTNPSLLNPSRVKRIARGAGRPEKDVNDLITKFRGMQKMMGMLGKNLGMLGKIPGLGALNQMKAMKNMMQNMPGGMGGSGGMGGLSSLFGGGSSLMGAGARKPLDKDKLRKARKDAKKARKKNRKK
jgi:signal recognition particle subunit SRP54